MENWTGGGGFIICWMMVQKDVFILADWKKVISTFWSFMRHASVTELHQNCLTNLRVSLLLKHIKQVTPFFSGKLPSCSTLFHPFHVASDISSRIHLFIHYRPMFMVVTSLTLERHSMTLETILSRLLSDLAVPSVCVSIFGIQCHYNFERINNISFCT